MIDFTQLYAIRNDIQEAVCNGDVTRLKKMFISDDTINLNYIDKNGQSPLHVSCTLGNLDLVKLLVANGACTTLINRDGWYPIHLASYYGHSNIVVYLITQDDVATPPRSPSSSSDYLDSDTDSNDSAN